MLTSIDECTYCVLSHFATAFGSNLTEVPIRNDGIRPAFACLKTVTFEMFRNRASSSAVKARPNRSIRSASVKDSGTATDAARSAYARLAEFLLHGWTKKGFVGMARPTVDGADMVLSTQVDRQQRVEHLQPDLRTA